MYGCEHTPETMISDTNNMPSNWGDYSSYDAIGEKLTFE